MPRLQGTSFHGNSPEVTVTGRLLTRGDNVDGDVSRKRLAGVAPCPRRLAHKGSLIGTRQIQQRHREDRKRTLGGIGVLIFIASANVFPATL